MSRRAIPPPPHTDDDGDSPSITAGNAVVRAIMTARAARFRETIHHAVQSSMLLEIAQTVVALTETGIDVPRAMHLAREACFGVAWADHLKARRDELGGMTIDDVTARAARHRLHGPGVPPNLWTAHHLHDLIERIARVEAVQLTIFPGIEVDRG